MKTPLLFLFYIVPFISIVGQGEVNTLYYESGQSDLPIDQINQLDSIILYYNLGELDSVNIQGHTDTVGSVLENQILSSQRAENVKAYFLSQGKCSELDSLFSVYNVDNTADLILAINKPLLTEFGVSTIKELIDTLPKVNLENIELAYRDKKISFDDYKFYIFNSSKLGWKNIDVFAKIPKGEMVKVRINEAPSRRVDCKLIFKDRQFVLPAKIGSDHFYFDGIPKGEKAWIIGIKYEHGMPLLAMQQITTGIHSFDLDFKQLTLENLKEELKQLDFEN